MMTKIDDYRIVHFIDLTHQQISVFQALVECPATSGDTPLDGRRRVNKADIRDIGPVVVKPYARGGLIGTIIQESYLRTGKVRSGIEFERLNQVREFGISAPEPLAYIWKGNLIYKCWLISRYIGDHQTLAGLSVTDENLARNILDEIKDQISILIDHNLLHVDLHPGNILIDKNKKPFIIDFDKARFESGSKLKLNQRYTRRWKRAVQKHRLPLWLNAIFD